MHLQTVESDALTSIYLRLPKDACIESEPDSLAWVTHEVNTLLLKRLVYQDQYGRTLLRESSKCDLVCANCHRERTQLQAKGPKRAVLGEIFMTWERRSPGGFKLWSGVLLVSH
jgi:hypothetical protein